MPSVPDSYLNLLRELPLRSIRTGGERDAAQAMVDCLLRQQLDRGAKWYLDALTDLIEVYEDKACPIPDAPEADVLRLLLEGGEGDISGALSPLHDHSDRQVDDPARIHG